MVRGSEREMEDMRAGGGMVARKGGGEKEGREGEGASGLGRLCQCNGSEVEILPATVLYIVWFV